VTHVLEDEREQHEAQVAVDGLRARRVLERQRADRALELGAPVMIAEEGQVGGQPRRVLEEIRDRDRFAIRSAPRGQQAGDAGLERESARLESPA